MIGGLEEAVPKMTAMLGGLREPGQRVTATVPRSSIEKDRQRLS